MNTLIQVAHDLKSNTLEAVWVDSEGKTNCRNFSPLQVEEFKEVVGELAQRYTDFADWTPEYIAAVAAEEQRLAAKAQAKVDAEEAERKAAKEKAEQEAFDAEVKRQVEIMKKAKEIVEGKK